MTVEGRNTTVGAEKGTVDEEKRTVDADDWKEEDVQYQMDGAGWN